MPRRKPDLGRALALSSVVIFAALLLLLCMAQLVRSLLATDAAADVDFLLSRGAQRLSAGLHGGARPPEVQYNASGRPAWREAHDGNATFLRLCAQAAWRPRVLRPPTARPGGDGWGSWLVLLENFTSAAEASAIVDAIGDSWRRAEIGDREGEVSYGRTRRTQHTRGPFEVRAPRSLARRSRISIEDSTRHRSISHLVENAFYNNKQNCTIKLTRDYLNL